VNGFGRGSGALEDSLWETIQQLSAMYNVSLQLNYTISTSALSSSLGMSISEYCFKLLNESQVDMLTTFFGFGKMPLDFLLSDLPLHFIIVLQVAFHFACDATLPGNEV
jgi:hypothetical protein